MGRIEDYPARMGYTPRNLQSEREIPSIGSSFYSVNFCVFCLICAGVDQPPDKG